MRNLLILLGICAVAAVAWFGLRGSNGPATLPISVALKSVGDATRIEIVSRGKSPITVRRILVNDRSNAYGCDFRLNLNKSEGGIGNFDQETLNEGEALNQDVFSEASCGEQIVKLLIETDQGSAEYNMQ